MGGSQLKRLKATLKSKGLTGVSNGGKSKNNKKNRPIDFRKQDKDEIIQSIREEFNPFDVKVNRNKHKVVTDTGNKRVVGKPSVSKSKAEEERTLAYEYQKSKMGKNNRIIDKRFGEGDNNLSMEEKMLERFTQEKVKNSTIKKSLFNLDDSDDSDEENGGLQLTHSGKSLYDQANGLGDSNKRYHDGNEDDDRQEQPQRKRTKAEIMKEVIAKSKFYKHERQKKQQELENKVQDLNDGFDDIMSELRTADAAVPKESDDEDELLTEKDKEYKIKYNALQFQGKSKPTTRTKTEEEIAKEYENNKKKLEEDRKRRMEGMDRENEVVGDDLGDNEYEDDFWIKNDSADEEELEENESVEQDEEEEEESEDGEASDRRRRGPKTSIVKCPETHTEFLEILSKEDSIYCIPIVNNIFKTYQSHLAVGNKEKVSKFCKVLLNHMLYLADLSETITNEDEYQTYVKTQNELILILQKVIKKHLVAITEEFRVILESVESRFVKSLESTKKSNTKNQVPKVSDLFFFTLIGLIYSTSDYYHLIVTPANTLLGEILNLVTFSNNYKQNIRSIFSGLYICDLLLNYQRLSKRYVPEVAIFLQQVCIIFSQISENNDFTCLIPSFKISKEKFNSIDLEKDFNTSKTLRISDLNKLYEVPEIEKLLFIKAMNLIQSYSENIWKEKSAFREIIHPFCNLLKGYELSISNNLLSIIENMIKFNVHIPLTLQYHKPIAIATYQPKFEVNFNPTKKYDESGNAELNKLKSQVRKERKLTIRELRKDNKFMARQKINETKQKYEDYHKKMAGIVNSINTIEGKERNQYEKEKRRSKNKK